MNHIFDHPLINTKNHESNQNTKINALHEEATQEKKLPDGIVDNPEAQSNVNVTQSTYGHHNTSAGGNHVHGDVNYNFYNHNPLSAEHLTPPAIAERPQSSHSATPPSKVPCVSPLAVFLTPPEPPSPSLSSPPASPMSPFPSASPCSTSRPEFPQTPQHSSDNMTVNHNIFSEKKDINFLEKLNHKYYFLHESVL